MSAGNVQIEVRSVTSAVVAALGDLLACLSATASPDQIALQSLGMEDMGWTPLAYSKDAFAIWRKQLELLGDDGPTLHHMAIMHHARALDLEAGPKPADSDADWTAAMGYWHRLHQLDAFWGALTDKACAGTTRPEVVKQLRADLPQRILAIHYDIALDEQTRISRKSRSKFHIALARRAPFDTEARTQAQQAAYSRYIALVVKPEVWQPNETREDVLDQGQTAIVEYLNYDPDCIPALEDALRLQRRIQRSRNTSWQAMDKGDPRRQALLSREKKDAEAWRPFFDQLAKMADALDEAVCEDLSLWYSGRGGDLCALDLEEQAIAFYEQAARVCRPDSDLRLRCRRDLARTWAYVAREKALNNDSGARALCNKVKIRDDLHPSACFLLAQAYMRLSLYDDAAAVCEKGAGIEPDFDDLEADEWIARLRELSQDMQVHKSLGGASDALKQGNFDAAVKLLDQAELRAKAAGREAEHASVYWLRCQAHLAMDHFSDSRRDLQTYKKLLGPEPSDSDVKGVQELTQMIVAREAGQSVKPVLEKARQAMEAGRFNDALPLLNDAAKKAPGNDVVYFLRCQVHVALGNMAEARKDAKSVSGLAESKEDHEAARRLDEMIEQAEAATKKAGGPEAKRLRERAIEAFNDDRHQEAIKLLRQAIELSKKAGHRDGAPQLKADLSQILTMAAVTLANASQERLSRSTSVSGLTELRTSLSLSQRMLEEAMSLDPSNSRAKENMSTLRQVLSQLP